MKTTTKLFTGILLLTVLSCTKEIQSKSPSANSIDMGTQITYHIGDMHGGVLYSILIQQKSTV